MRNWRSEKGAALVEAAVTIPLLLLVSVGIFEFGRAYQTWQVITNAAREGARSPCSRPPPRLPFSSACATTCRRGNSRAGAAAGITVDSGGDLTVNGAAGRRRASP